MPCSGRAAATLFLAVCTSGGWAMGLGTATLDSGLGEPLRFSVPVTLGPGEEVGCVQVRPRGDDLPAAVRARTSVIHSGDQTRVEVSTAAAVNEPAIGVVVSVGCTSPVAREFVFFLDPPQEPVLPSLAASVRNTVQPTVPRGPGAGRAERAGRAPVVSGAGTGDVSARRPRRVRPPAAARPAAPPAVSEAGNIDPAARTPGAPPVRGGDRLSVTPTESPADTTLAQARDATGRGGVPTASAAADATATGAGGRGDPDASARELAMRQQQAALDEQVRTLTEQIAVLRAQTSALAARNETLINRAEGPEWLRWLPLALAAIASAIAAWMAWRYASLRRSLEGSPWWSGNTVHAPAAMPPPETRFEDGELAPLDLGTRLAPRAAPGSDTRSAVATTAATGAAPLAEQRPRPSTRTPQRYSAAIETDFTVSDIEAAMATVRTVPTSPKPVQRIDETDFAALGGQTLPSPFADPPPAASRSAAADRAVATHANTAVATPAAAAPVPAPAQSRTGDAMDFNLDLPTAFDPLATDSHTRTAVDPPGGSVDFDVPLRATRSSILDLELPSPGSAAPAGGGVPVRHGGTALDDLFASDTGRLGADTILALDDGDGAPLSPTDVQRLSPLPTAEPLPAHSRMARFADLMNEVDETALLDPLRAIALLRQYVLRDETIPTLLWLRLFALYRTVDKKPVYEALAEHFSRRYLRPMVGWSQTLADRVPQTPLSSFHELDADIERAWGTAAGLDRLQTLLCGRDQEDAIVFNEVLQRDLLDTAKIFLLERDSSIGASKSSGH